MIRVCLVSLARVCAAIVLLGGAPVHAAAERDFTFVQISDTHVGTQDADVNFGEALADIAKEFPEADFIVNTGDVTEKGYEEEFARYLEVEKGAPVKVYEVLGNHDSRWSESGKENFREMVGPSYQVLDHKGVRFIMLDVSMLVEQYAHFDGIQLAKLEADLESLGDDQVAILCLHHPPLHRSRFMDNEGHFSELIRKHRVPVVLMGHIHSFDRYRINGTDFMAGGSTSSKGRDKFSYRVFRVKGDTMQCLTRNFRTGKTSEELPAALTQEEAPVGDLVIRKAGGGEDPLVYALENAITVPATTNYLVDNFLSGTAAAVKPEIAEYSAPVDGLAPGQHEVAVSLEAEDGSSHTRSAQFRTESEAGPRIVREFDLDAGSQAHPTVDGDVLYVAANDNMLRAIDLKSGEKLWEKDLGREILSTPVVDGEYIYIGSLDKNIYCLKKATGDEVWKFSTGEAVLATPLVADGKVFCGSGDYHLYALDAMTGKELWKFAASRLIKMTPALAGDRLIFGAWDNAVYCVKAEDGSLIWKIPASTVPLYSAATSNIATTGTRAIVCTHDYSVRCIDTGSGAHVWLHRPTGEELGPSYSSPVIVGDMAYTGSIDGRVMGFEVSTGKLVLSVPVRTEKADPLFDSIPLIVGRKLYIGSVGGYLYCLDLDSKAVEWSVALHPGFIFTRPAHWNGHILVASMAGKVYEVAPGQ